MIFFILSIEQEVLKPQPGPKETSKLPVDMEQMACKLPGDMDQAASTEPQPCGKSVASTTPPEIVDQLISMARPVSVSAVLEAERGYVEVEANSYGVKSTRMGKPLAPTRRGKPLLLLQTLLTIYCEVRQLCEDNLKVIF